MENLSLSACSKLHIWFDAPDNSYICRRRYITHKTSWVALKELVEGFYEYTTPTPQ
jgi:hypothetical protein